MAVWPDLFVGQWGASAPKAIAGSICVKFLLRAKRRGYQDRTG
jgi:hypothetical protein